ncbi:MAG: DUF692 domain-containing protein [Candidatus Obscuribacterales bacterium]|nr:DUF692 domain-containing protein [Candidatus Obscuribacterales bacterium]
MTESFQAIKKNLPKLGVGLGFRTEIAEQTLINRDSIDFLEIITEHYLLNGPTESRDLERTLEFQLIPHGIELSIGNVAELDFDYLKKLKQLLKRINAPWWSDHLSFTGVEGNRLHDLLPLPFSREAVDHVVKRIRVIQEFIETPFLLENVSSYMRMPGSEFSEAEFITEVVEQADCGLLLDVNNVYVNAFNHNYDPFDFINQLPLDRVVEIHIAGHKKQGSVIIDTHGARIIQPVYDLLAHTLRKTEARAILLERDQLFPKFAMILSEIEKIKEIAFSASYESTTRRTSSAKT